MKIKCGIAGYYKFEAVNAKTGIKRLLSDWNKNLITDAGMDMLGGSGNYLYSCKVGTGSSTPSFGDTALSNYLASHSSIMSTTYGTSSSAPYYCFIRNVYRFNAGVATGNISEVGVGNTSNILFSRSLILDGGGNPTTITVLSDEYLDVTYEYRYYAPYSDVTGSILLNGVSYSYTSRACNASDSSYISGWGHNYIYGDTENKTLSSTATGDRVYDGSIGSVTSSPSGNNLQVAVPTAGSYSAGSHSINHTFNASLSQGNLAAGISAIKTHIGVGAYQVGFSPAIPKTSSHVLSITFTHSWSRA